MELEIEDVEVDALDVEDVPEVEELLALLLEVVLVSVRLEEYLRVMLVTFTSRYFRLALWAGASER